MSSRVSILNNKGNFITNSNDSDNNSSSSSSSLTLSSSGNNRYYLYDVDDDDITKQAVSISSDINISNINSSSSSQDDATYIYITSSFDDNIIPMTLSSLSIISNARFLEIYTATSSTTNTTTATYDYLKTVRGTGINNIFTCSIDDIIRRVKSLKLKFLSVKDVNNTTSPTVKIYNIDCTINTDSDIKLNSSNTNTSKNNAKNDAGGSSITTSITSDASDNTNTRGNANPINTINPQMMMTYFNELDKMIDMKLSPIFKRLGFTTTTTITITINITITITTYYTYYNQCYNNN